MKKDDLKATLGAIRTKDELIQRTMERVQAERMPKEKRSWMQSLATPAFGSRLVAVACTLVLMFGLGVWAMQNDLFAEDPAVKSPHMAGETHLGLHSDDVLQMGDAENALNTLLEESAHLTGEWAIARGVSNAIYSSEKGSGEGKHHLIVSLSLNGIEQASKASLLDSDVIVADIYFDTDEEVRQFTDCLFHEIFVLIEKNAEGQEPLWTVKKIICKK